MKKRLLTLLLLLTLAFAFTACSDSKDDDSSRTERVERDEDEEDDADDKDNDKDANKDKDEPEVTETPEATEEPIATEAPVATEEPVASITTPTELSDNILDFQISINGDVYQFPTWYKDFESMGWFFTGDSSEKLMADGYTWSQEWIKDGASVYSYLYNPTINAATLDNCLVTGIHIDEYTLKYAENDFDVMLPCGIQINVSTLDDIIAAYGEPDEVYESSYYQQLTYMVDYFREVDLYVSSGTGLLTEIEIENMVALEGGDNNVYTEVPGFERIAAQYVAPTEVGTDLYTFQIELEGNLYALPCPFSLFLENGFTYEEMDDEEYVPAGGTIWVYANYNDYNYTVIIFNPSDYATIPENCFAIAVMTNYDPGFKITIPGNITEGTTEAEVLEVIKDFNYSKNSYESSFGNSSYYRIFDESGSYMDYYEIGLQNGVVTDISISVDDDWEY